VWAAYDEATAILAGDALLAEAFRLALTYPSPAVARELVAATIGMIGGQQLDPSDRAQVKAQRVEAGLDGQIQLGAAAQLRLVRPSVPCRRSPRPRRLRPPRARSGGCGAVRPAPFETSTSSRVEAICSKVSEVLSTSQTAVAFGIRGARSMGVQTSRR